MPGLRILLVEDDKAVRVTVRDALEENGHTVDPHADGESATTALQQGEFDIVLTDIRLPGCDGITLMQRARQQQPDCAIVLMTAYGRVQDAVKTIQAGAADYILKPFELDELVLRLERLGDQLTCQRAVAAGEKPAPECRLIGSSPPLRRVLRRLEAVAEAGVNALITGETGTGKELAARTIHDAGARKKGPFVQMNCAAIAPDLFETEMFGHEQGAFTGALRRREGRMATARGGTLFLDEIGELALDHQAKLLRALDAGTFDPVGSDRTHQADVALVAATNRNLREEVQAGRFRQDLLFRLNVIEIAMPPLRERRADLPELIGTFLSRIASRRRGSAPPLSPAAIAALLRHDYPGNVRELIHALEHGVALARGQRVELDHLPPALQDTPTSDDGAGLSVPLDTAVRQFEQMYISQTLEEVGGKRVDAAKRLGISRKSLWQKLKGAQ